MAEIHWIKLSTAMFDDEKVRLIQSMPEADAIITIWIRLLVMAGKTNDDGLIYIQRDMPYTDESLATVFGKQVNVVRLAMATLTKFHMIDVAENGTIAIHNWEKHQNVDGMEKVRLQTAERVKNFRERQKQKRLASNVTDNVTETVGNGTDSELDSDSDSDSDSDDKDRRRKTRSRVYVAADVEFQLAERLLEKIKEHNAEFKQPNLQSWSNDIRLMIERDHRKPGQVKNMIDWCQADSFWFANILSARKLREKYDQMKAQATRKVTTKTHVTETIPDWGKPKGTSLTKEQQAEISERIKRLNNRKEDDGE